MISAAETTSIHARMRSVYLATWHIHQPGHLLECRFQSCALFEPLVDERYNSWADREVDFGNPAQRFPRLGGVADQNVDLRGPVELLVMTHV